MRGAGTFYQIHLIFQTEAASTLIDKGVFEEHNQIFAAGISWQIESNSVTKQISRIKGIILFVNERTLPKVKACKFI